MDVTRNRAAVWSVIFFLLAQILFRPAIPLAAASSSANGRGSSALPSPQPIFSLSDLSVLTHTDVADGNVALAAKTAATLTETTDPETYTDETGRYRFQGLPRGTHKVTIDPSTLPPPLRPTEGEPVPVLWLTPGMEELSQPLPSGVRFTAAYDRESGDLSGWVFLDQNGDGRLDPTDPGIPGVRVLDPTVHQYYVPFDDTNLWALFDDKNTGLPGAQVCHPTGTAVTGTLDSSIFLIASSDGTIYYYDHWEDGYDPDPLLPGPTTEVGVLDAGALQLFQDDVDPTQVPDPSVFFYDGRDRITIVGVEASVVRLVFPSTPGVVLAGAWEVPEVADWGTSFVATVGEDLNPNDPGVNDHDFTGLEIMSALPGTQVYYNGVLTATLDAGETLVIDGANDGVGGGGVNSTDTITATAPIQIHMMTGGCGARYSAHGYTLQPVDVWTNDYWAPVPGFVCAGDVADSDIYLHNPNGGAISVTVNSNLGTADVPVPAKTTISLLDYVAGLGWNDISTGTSAIHLSSTDAFWGVSVIDSSSNGRGNSENRDWGYSLIPLSKLSSQSVVGYAPGNNDASPTDNANSAFVTVITDTVIYVDLDQDGLPDVFDMDGDGNANDLDVWGMADWDEPLSALGVPLLAGQTIRVGDPVDRNLEGALIYSLDYADKIAVAWGQDPCRSSPGIPYLDLGYTVLPVPIPSFSKVDDLAIDADLTGSFSPGDTITYTLVLYNNGLGSMDDAVLTDTLPYTHTDFVLSSLQITTPPLTDTVEYFDGALWTTTPTIDTQMFRVTWPTIGPRQTVTITFRLLLHTAVPTTVTSISNQAVVDASNLAPSESEDPDDPTDPDTDTPVERPRLSVAKFVAPTIVSPGGQLTYTLVVSNDGNGLALPTKITDVLPSWIEYVSGTLELVWPTLRREVTTQIVTRTSVFGGYYADDFDLTITRTTHYTGSDGSLDWTSDWTEVNDDGSPTSGRVQVRTNDDALTDPAHLWMTATIGGGAGVTRTVDLSQFISPTLRYHISGTSGLAGDDFYTVTLNGLPIFAEVYAGSYTVREITQALWIGAGNPAAALGFLVSGGLDAGDHYRFDNVAVYESQPVRVGTETLSWERTVLSYTTSTGGDPLFYDRPSGRMVITQGMRLPAGGVVTVTFQATVASPLTDSLILTNTACVTASNWVEISRPPCDDAFVQIRSGHALTITKVDDPDPVRAGNLLTYTLVYSAGGDAPAPNVIITDAVPAGTTFFAATGGISVDAPPVGSTGVVTWHLGTLLTATSGITFQTGVVTLVVRVRSDGAISPIVNTVWIRDDSGASDRDNESTDLAPPQTDLLISKLDDPDPVIAGGVLTYTLVYTNVGPSDAQQVYITDTLPFEVTFGRTVNLMPPLFGPTRTGRFVTWYTPTLVAGASGRIVFTVTVHSWVTRTFTNTVVISTTTPEIEYDNNRDEEPTAVTPAANLAIAKADYPDPVEVLGVLTYTLVYTNYGPSDAQEVYITDTLPFSVTFGGLANVEPSLHGPTVTVGPPAMLTWYTPTVPAGVTGTIVFTVTLQPDVGPRLFNTVQITTTTPETDASDNVADEPTDVLFPDLVVQKAVTPLYASVPGDIITWTIVYSNAGDAPAYDVYITDTLPFSVTYGGVVSVAPPLQGPTETAGPPPALTWYTPSLSVGGYGVIVFTTTSNVTTSPDVILINTVHITTTTPETDITNNDDEARTPLLRLSVAKRVSRSPVLVGEWVSFTLYLTNTGGITLTTVPVTDTYDPTYLAFVPPADPAESSRAAGLITWANIGPLLPGEGSSIVITFTALAVPPGGWTTNRMTATGSYSDAILPPVGDSDDVEILQLTDVTIVKADDVDPVVPGGPLVYTLVYTNNGPSDAENVVVSDTLPSEVAFVSASPDRDSGPNPLAWNLGTVGAGASDEIVVTVTVHSWVTQTFTNTVLISTTTPETDYDNNRDEEPTTPLEPNLSLVKSVSPSEVTRNMPLTYTLCIANTGPVTFDPLVLTDTLPSDFYYVASSGNPSDPDIVAEPALVWQNLGPLNPGDSITITFQVTATPGITGPFLNVAIVNGAYPGGAITDTDDAPVTVVNPRIALDKRLADFDSDPVAPNYVTFTIVITNIGVSTIDVVPLLDQYDPYYLSFVWAEPIPNEPEDDGILTWYDLTAPGINGFGQDLLPGESFLVTAVFSVVHDITSTINTAIVPDTEDIYNNPVPGDLGEAPVPGVPTAIELLYFTVSPQPGSVLLEWATAVEIDNYGFSLLRSSSGHLGDAQEIAFLPAMGYGRGSGALYRYRDLTVQVGVYYTYWLVDIDTSGKRTIHSPVTVLAMPHHRYLPLILR